MSSSSKAHENFRAGKYKEALEIYSDALDASTVIAHRIALFSNRAACYLKLQQFKQAAEECSAVLELDDKHKGALMLRAQTLVILKDYHSAQFDVNRLIDIDPDSQVYRELQSRIKTQLALAPILEAENEASDQEIDSTTVAAETHFLSSSPSPSPSPNTVLQVTETPPSISQPKKQSGVDYSRWNSIGDDLSDDEEDESQPQYKYRLRTVGLRAAAGY